MPGRDLILQTSNHGHAVRLLRHFQDRLQGLLTFPQAFADEAVHLGPRPDDPCAALVLFRGVRMGRSELLDWLLAATHVKRAVMRVYWLDRPALPTWDALLADIADHGGPPEGAMCRLACCPRSMELTLAAAMPKTWTLDLQSFTHVLAVVHFGGAWRWSLTPAALAYRQGVCNELFDAVGHHAVYKLDEACSVLGLGIAGMSTVVDLGAAPGTWTAWLANHASLVLAVDPAELHPDVLARPNVRHLKMRSEEAVPVIRRMLGGDQVDLLVCDMNMHPAEASDVVATLLPCLRPGAHVILTLKFSGRSQDRSKSVKLLTAKYQDLLEEQRFVWLFANTNCEMTYIGRRGMHHHQEPATLATADVHEGVAAAKATAAATLSEAAAAAAALAAAAAAIAVKDVCAAVPEAVPRPVSAVDGNGVLGVAAIVPLTVQ